MDSVEWLQKRGIAISATGKRWLAKRPQREVSRLQPSSLNLCLMASGRLISVMEIWWTPKEFIWLMNRIIHAKCWSLSKRQISTQMRSQSFHLECAWVECADAVAAARSPLRPLTLVPICISSLNRPQLKLLLKELENEKIFNTLEEIWILF